MITELSQRSDKRKDRQRPERWKEPFDFIAVAD
jgi:hypothetical protein